MELATLITALQLAWDFRRVLGTLLASYLS